MEQYIPKSAIAAEIDNLLDKGKYHEEYDCAYRDGNNGALYALKDKLDTIEVKEVDLEKEKDDYWNKLCNSEFGELFERDAKWFDDIAKHFFELGLKVQKGISQ